MDERRRYQRQILVMYLHIFDLRSGKVLGYLGDISAQGLMLISEEDCTNSEPLALGIRVEPLQADLGYVNRFEHEHIACMAQWRWSRCLEEGLFSSGFMFTHLEPKAEDAILALMQNASRDTPPSTISGRYMEVLLHLEHPLSIAQREKVGNYLSQQHGMIAVNFEEETPHLVVAQYHPDRITPLKMLDGLASQDIHAHLIEF